MTFIETLGSCLIAACEKKSSYKGVWIKAVVVVVASQWSAESTSVLEARVWFLGELESKIDEWTIEKNIIVVDQTVSNPKFGGA